MPSEYPRTRGDNVPTLTREQPEQGIPPHTRGQLQRGVMRHDEPGNTPAHAGTTLGQHLVGRTLREYPRTRGDNMTLMDMRLPVAGIPPHTRGQPLLTDRYYHLIV